jgi:subtilase family serine protease
MKSTTFTSKWRRGKRRTFVTLGAGALVVSMTMIGGPIIGSAGADNSSSTYTVSPIAVQAPASLLSKTGQFPGPGFCAAVIGLACYTPQIFHTAYEVPWTINGQWAGTGEQVAIVDAFGSPTVAADLAIYDAEFGLPAANLHVYYPGGQVPYSPMARKGLQTGWAEETSLDVQTVHDLAPGARINLIVASSPSGNVLNNAVQYAVSNHLGDVLSMSYGSNEASIKGNGNNIQWKQADAAFAQAVSQGISVFASSGDSGATGGASTANASFPASDPNVTAAGGTNLFVAADADASGLSADGTWTGETTWNDADPAVCPFGCTAGIFGATGGAPSSLFSAASYQKAASGQTARSTSDVSFNASVYTGSLIYIGFMADPSANGFYFFGGTSEASPAWAAITADLDQAHGSDLGAMNPILYGLAASSATYAADFHDVTLGDNNFPTAGSPGFAAGTGYDMPTGLGTPIVNGLLTSLAASTSTWSSSPPA